MASEIIVPELRKNLASAHRIVETLVFRTKEGRVFTAEIGETLLPEATHPLGAKITQVSETSRHVGIVEGKTLDDVRLQAQQLIAKFVVRDTIQSAVPRPHVRPSANVNAQPN